MRLIFVEAAQLKIVISGMMSLYASDRARLQQFLRSLGDGDLDQLRGMPAIEKLRFLQRLFNVYRIYPGGRG
jgi:hypothetical protein